MTRRSKWATAQPGTDGLGELFPTRLRHGSLAGGATARLSTAPPVVATETWAAGWHQGYPDMRLYEKYGLVDLRRACPTHPSVGVRHEDLVGEPDAGNPHVRFDERGVETEHGRILWHRQPKGPATRMADLNPPRHSSTLLV